MTKSDLKTGMIIELRNNECAMVLLRTNDGDVFSGDTWGYLLGYRDDLTSIHGGCFDIVKIYQPNSNIDYLHGGLNKEYTKLIWKRETVVKEEIREVTVKDIEEKLGCKVRIIG